MRAAERGSISHEEPADARRVAGSHGVVKAVDAFVARMTAWGATGHCNTYVTYVSSGMTSSDDALIPGTLNVLILSALRHGPMHGYGITKWILDRSEEALRVQEGVLYPALHRLQKERCLEAEWGRNDTGRRAKFYSLTSQGRARLHEELSRWRRSSGAVDLVVEPAGGRLRGAQ